MKLLFAVVPWHSLDYPCLGVGILSALAKRKCLQWQLDQRYLNVDWSCFLYEVSHGEFTPIDYCLLSEEFVFSLAGEWVFSSALHEVEVHQAEAYRAVFTGDDDQFAKIAFAHRHAYRFISDVAEEIVAQGYDVVALSSTFTQNAACLALGKAIKKIKPSIITMMGGGNCDGVQGVALHRNYRFIDYVVRGEGEASFPMLLDALATGDRASLVQIPGLCWWEDSVQRINESSTTEDMDSVPIPWFDDYFAQIESSPVRPFIEPVLVMETARGCWWGEKHHCTFCGLNGTGMKFRSKSQDRALQEVEQLVSRYQILDIVVADNILDMQYFKSFLPSLASKGWDLRVHYEIKANLKADQIEVMRQAGIAHVQPGIESLSSKVLALMEKGITGARNVQSLRDCEAANLTVSWNYLLGFPGESESDYVHIIEQIPNMVHLQPPAGATRLTLERFSPYFNKPWMGFESRLPHPAYGLIYQLPADELEEFSFFFRSPPAGIGDELLRQLQSSIGTWREEYRAGRTLVHRDRGSTIEISDRRRRGFERDYTLSDPLQRSTLRLMSTTQTRNSLHRILGQQHGCSEQDVDRAVAELLELGLIFHDDRHYVRLSTPSIPFRNALQ